MVSESFFLACRNIHACIYSDFFYPVSDTDTLRVEHTDVKVTGDETFIHNLFININQLNALNFLINLF